MAVMRKMQLALIILFYVAEEEETQVGKNSEGAALVMSVCLSYL